MKYERDLGLSVFSNENRNDTLNDLVAAYSVGERYVCCGSYGHSRAAAKREAIDNGGGEDAQRYGAQRICDQIAFQFTGKLPLSADEKETLFALGRALIQAAQV